MPKDVLEYCKRRKSFTIAPTLKKVLLKAFVNSNAAKLPYGSFSTMYAEKSGLLEEMRSSTNHIIWGRRGTGKTHLLNAFVEKINDDDQISDIALYISCDRMARESPREPLVFSTEYDRIRFFANETYKNFMDTLCEQLLEQYEELLQFKKRAINTERFFEDYLQDIGNKILTIMDINSKGVPRSYSITGQKDLSNSANSQNSTGINAEIEVETSGIRSLFKGFLGKSKSTNIEKNNKIEEKIRFEHFLPAIQKLFSELIEQMGINCLYICIDELWLVDDKNSISFQPFFLDNIRATLGTQPKIGIKIASIRETTNLNNKTNIKKTYGMQSGNDIIELAYLDPVQSKMAETYEMFKEIVVKRINYHLSKEPLTDHAEDTYCLDVVDADYVIKMLFKEERNFKSLVDMSHGIPRNFINMLNTCLRRLEYNVESCYIHYYLISDVVIDTYKNEHRSDVSFASGDTLYEAIDQYARQNKKYFFLVQNKVVNRLKAEFNSLLYKEIVHRIPSSETPLNIMNSHKAYYLDLGMYFLSIREYSFSEYERIVQNFQLLIPTDLQTNYKQYLLDLRNISGDYVTCPHCNNIFPKTHPVYSLYKICPDCALSVPDGEVTE